VILVSSEGLWNIVHCFRQIRLNIDKSPFASESDHSTAKVSQMTILSSQSQILRNNAGDRRLLQLHCY